MIFRIKQLFILILLLVCFAGFLFAQDRGTRDEWYTGKKIENIKFEGLKNITEGEVVAVAAQFIGRAYTDELLQEIWQKLFALNYFIDIVPKAFPGKENLDRTNPQNTVVIVFTVTERPVVKHIQINGNKSIRRNQILEVILLKPGDIVTKAKLNVDEDAVYNLYIEKGFPSVKISSEIGATDSENTADIIFTVDEGQQTKIGEIKFRGNTLATESALRKALATKKQSLFSKGLFLESKIEEDKQNLIKYYGERGCLDAKVLDVLKEFTEDAEGKTNLVITFIIDEGKQYKFSGIIFEGNIIYKDEELQELIRSKKGEVLDKSLLETDFSRISDLYYNDGYIFNSISREEIRNEEDLTAAYKIKIVERGRAHIENIVIRGNDKTKEHVIKRELPLEVGDVFSKRGILQGMGNLFNLQFFDVIEPETPQGSSEGLMDLIINVEEGKTIDVNFGLTFTAAAGDLPIMAFVTWTDRNFLGNGQELSVGTELSGVLQRVTFGFKENWLMGRRWTGGVTLSVQHRTTDRVLQDILGPTFAGSNLRKGEVPDPFQGIMVDPDSGRPSTARNAITDYEYALRHGYRIPETYLMEYTSWDISLGLNTGYTWHTPIGRFNASTGYTFTRTWIDYDAEHARPYNETIRENYQDWQSVNRIWISAYWDTRDIVYNPTEGFYLKQSVTYTGGILPSKRNYIATNSKFQFFYTLFSIPVFKSWEFKTIFAANTSISFIFNQFDGRLNITTDDLFYIDGLTMARGWDRVYDGQVLWDSWVELRTPIIERYIWWDIFYSITGLWPEKDLFYNLTKNDFYFSIGTGFRLTIPGLPIGFYLVKKYQYIDDKVEWYKGAMFPDSLGLDFVIGFTPNFF